MAADNLYPFSTPRGEAVPLEIVKPLSLLSYAFADGVAGAIVIPAGYSTVWIYATANCILRFDGTALPAALVDGTEYTNSVFIPADTAVTLYIAAGDAQLLGLGDGNIYINSITQWAALNQPIQTSVG